MHQRSPIDDGRLSVRALEPTDRDALADAFDRLSPRSRQQRFLAHKPTLSDRELSELTRSDHRTHDALVAIDPADDAIVAIARYATWPQATGVADLAIEVFDGWQGRGVGRALTGRIIERDRAGSIGRLTAGVLSENRAAFGLLRSFGFRVVAHERGVTDLALDLER
jgi:L-amino acid N-acyltransferase YncA